MASVVDRIAGDVERSDGEVLISFNEFNSTFTANISLRSMVVSAGKISDGIDEIPLASAVWSFPRFFGARLLPAPLRMIPSEALLKAKGLKGDMSQIDRPSSSQM